MNCSLKQLIIDIRGPPPKNKNLRSHAAGHFWSRRGIAITVLTSQPLNDRINGIHSRTFPVDKSGAKREISCELSTH